MEPKELTKQDILDMLADMVRVQSELFAAEAEKRKKAMAEEAEKRKKDMAAEAEKRKKDIAAEAEKREKAIALADEERRKDDERYQKRMEAQDRKLNRYGDLWGQFVEEMVEPGLVALLQGRGVEVRTTFRRVPGMIGKQRVYEVDLLAVDGDIAVAVEVKTTLRKADVIDHLARLEKMRELAPVAMDLRGYTLLGAVAGITVEPGVAEFAEANGLFVLRQDGSLLGVANGEGFVPKEWKTLY